MGSHWLQVVIFTGRWSDDGGIAGIVENVAYRLKHENEQLWRGACVCVCEIYIGITFHDMP
jgi:hypothetical protein